MRSFGILATFTAAFSGLATAFTKPVGQPSGNPIYKPNLGDQVPCGKPYVITWDPTTPGTVSILLLRGPSENVVPIATLVEGYQNTGKYSWTPSTDLEPDTTHYGLQLIVDGTGQYQYSTQFGISNPDFKGKSSTTSGSSTTTTDSASVSGKSPTTATGTTTTPYPTTSTTKKLTTTSYPISNSTVTLSTKSTTKPLTAATHGSTTLYTTAAPSTTSSSPASHTTYSVPPSATGGASRGFISFGMGVLSVAVVGFALL